MAPLATVSRLHWAVVNDVDEERLLWCLIRSTHLTRVSPLALWRVGLLMRNCQWRYREGLGSIIQRRTGLRKPETLSQTDTPRKTQSRCLRCSHLLMSMMLMMMVLLMMTMSMMMMMNAQCPLASKKALEKGNRRPLEISGGDSI